IRSRTACTSAMLACTAWWKRLTSSVVRSAGTWRSGMSRSSASSTTAVLITTPGETPMPFFISMQSRIVQKLVGRAHLPLFFAELAFNQFGELADRLVGVVALRVDPQRRPGLGGED